jgi:hypothetical protein
VRASRGVERGLLQRKPMVFGRRGALRFIYRMCGDLWGFVGHCGPHGPSYDLRGLIRPLRGRKGVRPDIILNPVLLSLRRLDMARSLTILRKVALKHEFRIALLT